MSKTKIEWSDESWNPVTGCTKVSPGCKNCYAEPTTYWLTAMGQEKYAEGFGNVVLHDGTLNTPLEWKKPSMVFVNSMSDLFHKDVSDAFIHQVFEVMVKATQHFFQVLTKRPERMATMSASLPWAPNIWAGVSIENNDYLLRINYLRKTGAAIKFLSLEPLLGPLPNLDLTGIDWVIVGGESGRKARPMDEAWAIDIRNRCLAARVPFFFKQWGHLKYNPDPSDPTAKQNGGNSKGGRLLQGREWSEMPVTNWGHRLRQETSCPDEDVKSKSTEDRQGSSETPSHSDFAVDNHRRNLEMDADKVETLLRAGDMSRMEIGGYLACRYYSDSRREFEDHRTKNYSLLKLVEILAERKNVKVSKSTLHNCIAVYFQERDLGLEPDQVHRLSFAARVALLPVKDVADKRSLVRNVFSDQLTVRDLKSIVRGGKEPKKMSASQRLKRVAEKVLDLAEVCIGAGKEDSEDLSAAIAMLGSALGILTESERKTA